LILHPFYVVATILACAGNWERTFKQNENNMMPVEKP
jgi:hypothetical protein